MAFRISEVHFNESTYKLINASNSESNVFTVLIGKNGCGKSRLLQIISNSFAVSDQLLREQPHRWDELTNIIDIYRRVYFKYYCNGNEITANSVNEGLASAFLLREHSDDYTKFLPKQLICLSTSPFDRFPKKSKYPLNRQDGAVNPSIYSYIGLKDGVKISSVNNLINIVIKSLLDNPTRIENNFHIINNTLSFLGYGNRFRFTVRNHIDINSLDDIKSGSKLLNIIKKIKHIEGGYFDDEYKWNEQKKEISESIFRVFNYSDSSFKKKITFTIKVDSMSDDYDHLTDISTLLKLGLFTIDSFKLSQKDDNRRFIDFSLASSGEQCLTLMLLGIAGKIENNSLICIDEPEISLHPEWQCKFIPLLRSIYSNYSGCHFIIATHSPHITSNLDDDHSYILKMDDNEIFTSNEYRFRSIDYQLATLFESPGYHNEYLNRLCVKLLCNLSKNRILNTKELNEFEFLLSIKDKIERDDNIIDLINVLQNGIQAVEGSNNA